jgi:hypothetical protein
MFWRGQVLLSDLYIDFKFAVDEKADDNYILACLKSFDTNK